MHAAPLGSGVLCACGEDEAREKCANTRMNAPCWPKSFVWRDRTTGDSVGCSRGVKRVCAGRGDRFALGTGSGSRTNCAMSRRTACLPCLIGLSSHRERGYSHGISEVNRPRNTVCREVPASYTTSAILFLHLQPLELLSNNRKSAGWPGSRLREVAVQPMTVFARHDTVSCIAALAADLDWARRGGYLHISFPRL